MNAPVVSIESLTKSFGDVEALADFNAEVHKGDVIAVLGLNGAGKTTLLETLLGFSLPDSGSVKLFGVETRVLTDQKVKTRIGFVPQQEELLPSLRVRHYLDLIGSFYTSWDGKLVDRLCSEWQLPIDKRIRTLSVGQRQKVAIISSLGFHPELLILDEPVATLDPKARRQFLGEIIKLTESNQCTVLFSTHIVADVERIADRLWLLKDGRLHLNAAIDDIKESTVRVHLHPIVDVAPLLSGLNVIRTRESPLATMLTLSGWNEDAESLWREKISADLKVEPLSLEEIFLEVSA